ncbi:putative Zinc finger C2H2 superfamily [Septoria linicola]|nr:putative Zinc finger C2H2 superfamily [Septoria linicola]
MLTCPHHQAQHMREAHTGERPYVCKVCADLGKERAFARNASLLRHLRTVHRLDTDAVQGRGNRNNPSPAELVVVEGSPQDESNTTYPSPAPSHVRASSEAATLESGSSPATTAVAVHEPGTTAPSPALIARTDFFANDYIGTTRCAFCQNVVEDIRTHVDSCLNGDMSALPTEHPTAFDEEMADLHAFSDYLDEYQAQFDPQQPTPRLSPLTETEAVPVDTPSSEKLDPFFGADESTILD